MSPAVPIIVLAIDPGTRKCGIAVVQNSHPPQTLFRAVVETPTLANAVSPLMDRFAISTLLIGDATGAALISDLLRPVMAEGVPIHLVPEAFTTQRARTRWCQENPPRTLWERLLPGFRTPTSPIDDYAAVILAEQYFTSQ